MAKWTQEQLDAQRAKVASGVQSVSMGDRNVTNYSLKDEMALLAQMEADLAVDNGDRQSYRLAAHSKGV